MVIEMALLTTSTRTNSTHASVGRDQGSHYRKMAASHIDSGCSVAEDQACQHAAVGLDAPRTNDAAVLERIRRLLMRSRRGDTDRMVALAELTRLCEDHSRAFLGSEGTDTDQLPSPTLTR
jgi:hypothetical protein